MKPRMIWANLAVADLERTQKFYSELGFRSNNPHTSKELVSFFMAVNELIIHFFLKDVIANNLKSIKFGDPQRYNEIVFTFSAESKSQVDGWAEEVKNAGRIIVQSLKVLGKITMVLHLLIRMDTSLCIFYVNLQNIN